MEITGHGTDTIWRASEIDKARQCMRYVGYARLGTVETAGSVPVELKPQYTWNLIAGLALDDTLCVYSQQQMTQGTPEITGKKLIEFFAWSLDRRGKEFSAKGPIVGDDNPGDIMHDACGVLPIYEREHAPTVKPVGVQVETTAQIDNVTLIGHIDLVRRTETNQIITDWKFTNKTANQMPASTYARGWAYDLMHGDGSGHIELVLFRRGLKTPKIEVTSHFVTPAQHKQVVQEVKTLAAMYRARYFPMADPSSWLCSPKFCGFWTLCRGNPNGPEMIPGEA